LIAHSKRRKEGRNKQTEEGEFAEVQEMRKKY